MTGDSPNFLSTGIYTVSDAARYSGVSIWRIRRWLKGYRFRTRKRREHHSPPLWQGQLKPIDQTVALGFLDLIEIRFVDAFLQAGISWNMLRKAHQRGVALLEDPYPFCTNRVMTDGREIFIELHRQTGEKALIDIAHEQQVFAQITRPLLDGLEFGNYGVLLLWRPRTAKGSVVLDPARNFGRPIVASHGVPTEVLAEAVGSCGSLHEAAHWFEVDVAEVEDALEFEQSRIA